MPVERRGLDFRKPTQDGGQESRGIGDEPIHPTGSVQKLQAALHANKHKVSKPGTGRFPDEHLYDKLGLIRLPERTRSFSWAKS